MTKIISITMATIIMLTVGINTELITSAGTPTKVTASVSSSQKRKKKRHKHFMPKGNMVRLRPLAVRDGGSNKNCRTVKILRPPYRAPQKFWVPLVVNKWFKSKKALKKYVSKVMNKYNRQYENGEITWDEYVRRCPYGYEAWSCSCGKWTGNFKYHKG